VTGEPRLGVVINPVAGMGGRVGLHGTDGASLSQALERGAEPVAPLRARRALRRLNELVPRLSVITAGGEMGSAHLPETAWDVTTLDGFDDPTTADDTRRAIARMVSDGVALVLFVGGDGTARDVVADAAEVPMLGVPAGVKMHSGVFATGPETAAEIAARFLADPVRVGTRDAEVVDLDQSGLRIYAVARVPAASRSLQRSKTSVGVPDDASLLALGREIAAEMVEDALYLLGPGTTIGHVNAALGLPASALGVDAVVNGTLVARDAGESELLELLGRHRECRLVLGVVGGQGFLLGRGNQQLSPAVLDAIGVGNIDVLAAPSKIASLTEPVLHIDIDDAALSERLTGYRPVRTAPGRSTVLRVMAS